MRGHYVEPIDDHLKERFLDLVASGYTRQEACEALDASARQFRSLCSPKSHRYDAEFARQYAKLTEKDGEHEQALAERLESTGIQRALRSSDRLLEKYSTIYDPKWAIHKPQTMQINFNIIEQIRAEFQQLPDAALQEYIAQLEETRMKELDSGLPVIDVDAK